MACAKILSTSFVLLAAVILFTSFVGQSEAYYGYGSYPYYGYGMGYGGLGGLYGGYGGLGMGYGGMGYGMGLGGMYGGYGGMYSPYSYGVYAGYGKK
ncbi:hypothetical protein DdX_17478 [Ditylenchus destructor]|uniref:Uncharacterized protein n=1 Tax=Ditylenchus destructor TaxID=166010 RepID=A0AAD4MMY1_9BILA|nr:hypothetical protein DdX_17478 [Ditylenchus destructor]